MKKNLQIPYDLIIELSVIGVALMDDNAAMVVLSEVKVGDFYSLVHQEIYKSMLRLRDKEVAIDIITVRTDLQNRKKFNIIGGSAYLSELLSLVPTTALVDKYIVLLKEKSNRRKLLSIAQKIESKVLDESSDINKIAATLQDNISNILIGENRLKVEYNIKSVIDNSFQIRCDTEVGQIKGFKTGIVGLDEKLDGQLKGKFLVINGYNSHGKSTLLSQMASNALMDGAKCLYISTESSEVEIVNKMLANISDREIYDFKYNVDIKIGGWYDKLNTKPLSIVSGITDADKIINLIKAYNRKGLIDCVYIDYIQNITSDRFQDERKLLDYFSRAMQNLALPVNENLCIVMASQMDNFTVKNKIGFNAGTRGSGQISASSDVTIRIVRELSDTGEKTY